MAASVVFEKLCNAFYPDAQANTDVLPAPAMGAVERYRRKHGGLWVGGRVTVREDEIQFAPNGLNVAFHRNAVALIIPFEWVRAVQWEFGVVTGIVVVRCADFDFRFRCFGAKGVVSRLSALVEASRSGGPRTI